MRERAELIKKDVFTFIFIGRLSIENGIRELWGHSDEISGIRLLLLGWEEYDSKELKDSVSQIIIESESVTTRCSTS